MAIIVHVNSCLCYWLSLFYLIYAIFIKCNYNPPVYNFYMPLCFCQGSSECIWTVAKGNGISIIINNLKV